MDNVRQFCPNCGAPVYVSDDVCMECGYDLRLGATLEEAPIQRRRDFHQWAAEKALARNRYRVAEQHFAELWELSPEDFEVGRQLALVQERQGAYNRALETWHRLLMIHDSDEIRTAYIDCVIRIAQMQTSRHAFEEAVATCETALNVVGDDARLRRQINNVRDAEVDYQREERGYSEARKARTQVATVAGGFAIVTGVLTMIAGILLIMLSIAMVPCCIGIFILPFAFSVFVAGVGMMAGAPVGGAAIWTLGELPRAMKRFGEYWEGLPQESRTKAVIAIIIAVGVMLLLSVIGWIAASTPAGTGY